MVLLKNNNNLLGDQTRYIYIYIYIYIKIWELIYHIKYYLLTWKMPFLLPIEKWKHSYILKELLWMVNIIYVQVVKFVFVVQNHKNSFIWDTKLQFILGEIQHCIGHTHTHMFLAHHVLFPKGRTTMDYLLFFNFINIIYVITIIPIS